MRACHATIALYLLQNWMKQKERVKPVSGNDAPHIEVDVFERRQLREGGEISNGDAAATQKRALGNRVIDELQRSAKPQLLRSEVLDKAQRTCAATARRA